jgi:hypothetical protein
MWAPATRGVFRRMHGQPGVARGLRTARISIGRFALVAPRMDAVVPRASAEIALFHRLVRPWNGESIIGPSMSKSGGDRPGSQYLPFLRIDDESRHPTAGVDAGGDDPVSVVLQRTHEAISMPGQYRRDISSRNARLGFGLGFGSYDRLRGIIAIGRVEALRGRLPRRGERGQCERRREAHPKNKGFRSSPQAFHREFPIIVLPRLSGREVSASIAARLGRKRRPREARASCSGRPRPVTVGAAPARRQASAARAGLLPRPLVAP